MRTPEQLVIAIRETKELLDKLVAQSMEHARRVRETNEILEALTGDIEAQWQTLQKIRSEIAAQLSSDSPKIQP